MKYKIKSLQWVHINVCLIVSKYSLLMQMYLRLIMNNCYLLKFYSNNNFK
jgi:hypothetical protein